MIRNISIICGAFASFVLASPAAGATVFAEFNGFITEGSSSGQGVFGTITYGPDPVAISGRFSFYDPGTDPDSSTTGAYASQYTDGDFIEAQVTIAGVTYTFGNFGATTGELKLNVYDENPDRLDLSYALEKATDEGELIGAETFVLNLLNPNGDPISGGGLPANLRFNGGSGLFVIQTATDTADISFTIERASAPLAIVPEPQVWLQMIIGFGLVGGALRRRSRLRAAIA